MPFSFILSSDQYIDWSVAEQVLLQRGFCKAWLPALDL
jgi:hypothetical protein